MGALVEPFKVTNSVPVLSEASAHNPFPSIVWFDNRHPHRRAPANQIQYSLARKPQPIRFHLKASAAADLLRHLPLRPAHPAPCHQLATLQRPRP